VGSSLHPYFKGSINEVETDPIPHVKEVQNLSVCGEVVFDSIFRCTVHSPPQILGSQGKTECRPLLHNAVAPERCNLNEMPWLAEKVILLHDNAHNHTDNFTRQILEQFHR
jgi:hypothetical protein